MADVLEVRRPRINWEQILAQAQPGLTRGVTAQGDMMTMLMPLLFKAQIEKQAKEEQLAQFPTRLKAIKEALGGNNDFWVKGIDPATGEFEIEIKTPKQRAEDLEAQELLGETQPQGVSAVKPVISGIPVSTGGIGGIAGKKLAIKVAETKALEQAKGISGEQQGRVALARESIKNIDDVKNMLFPKGTAKSYQRFTALGSNLPLSSLPIIPSNVGTYKPQTIFRKMGAALSGRQLIQTGVAARPEETLKLVGQFAPSGLMSSQAALEGLNELQAFYKDYLHIAETRGVDMANNWAENKGKSGQTSSGIKYTVE